MGALVLDTSAFIQGFDPPGESLYTVPLVEAELGDALTLIRLRSAVAAGRLIVAEPEESYTDRLEAETLGMGESLALSETDKQVLALGLQLSERGLEPTVVSDDYSVQNMAEALGLRHRGLATPGIKRQLRWVLYCPGCRREFGGPQPDGVCPVCGTELKRKPAGKRRVRRRGS
ncbi:hypothetical protein JXL21_11150 [Candidatus Bathyarchaeota archaeon]|nr:hypothetical protein [Candidatus Bathyarchaeota archaeon]